MNGAVLGIFGGVYVVMLLGRLPGLGLDRTGAALLGAIGMVVIGALSPEQARDAIDVPTIALLFGLMIVSAQLRLGGFYTAVTRRLASAPLSPPRLLGLLVATAGLLSAVLVNDIICLAMTPILIDGCAARRLRPLPFLLGLACASNVGSAATLIGNPQNMLIGQSLQLSFGGYLLTAAVPVLGGLLLTWGLICALTRGRWTLADAAGAPTGPAPLGAVRGDEAPPFDRAQTAKGLLVVLALVVLFVDGRWPREVLALGAAGLLLLSRRLLGSRVLALVDWPLLVLFAGLFVVNRALAQTGAVADALAGLSARGLDLAQPAPLYVGAALLSNLVSNVPAVMLLLPAATHELAGPILALSSTLAGNLLLVGSIANLIVVEQAARRGVSIGWREHARVGIPVTLASLALAALWLWLTLALRTQLRV